MFKPRHTTQTRRRLPTEGATPQLSAAELSMIFGGQSQPDPGQELADQAERTFDAWVDFVEPLVAPVRETAKLVYDAGSYVRWAAEYRESHEISDERGRQLEAEEREAAEQKERERQEENERFLQGDGQTTGDDVAAWLDIPPQYTGEVPSIPSHMVNSGPSREVEIIIEEIVDGSYY